MAGQQVLSDNGPAGHGPHMAGHHGVWAGQTKMAKSCWKWSPVEPFPGNWLAVLALDGNWLAMVGHGQQTVGNSIYFGTRILLSQRDHA